MAMLRYTGGGPTYVEDPRVAEAQRWAQLGQGRAALDAQREAGIRAAQAAVAQAEIEAESRTAVAQQQAAARELEAEQALARALLQEQGWTERVGLQEAGQDRRRAASDRAAMERAQLQAGSGSDRAEADMLRFLLQEQGQDRRAEDRNMIDLLGLLPRQERDPDALERGELIASLVKQAREGESASGVEPNPLLWRELLGEAGAYGPQVYNPVLEAIQRQARMASAPPQDRGVMGSVADLLRLPTVPGPSGFREWLASIFEPSAPQDVASEFLAEEPMPEKVDRRTELLLKRLGL